jgi:hypothetical protein
VVIVLSAFSLLGVFRMANFLRLGLPTLGLPKLLFPTLLLTVMAASAAQASPHSVNYRQNRQQVRIYRGVSQGQIGPREYADLQRRSASIELQQRRFRRDDGRIDPYERSVLNRRLNRVSGSIYEDRRD